MKALLKLWRKIRPPVIRYWIRFQDDFLIVWDTTMDVEEAWRHLPHPGERFAGRIVEAITCFRIK